MKKALLLQKAVYGKILDSHLKNIKNPPLLLSLIEQLQNVDKENVIL
jgi:hypothetical protein